MTTRVKIWLVCVDCKKHCATLRDDRCIECFYVYTGGDLGDDNAWHKRVRVRNGCVYMEYR